VAAGDVVEAVDVAGTVDVTGTADVAGAVDVAGTADVVGAVDVAGTADVVGAVDIAGTVDSLMIDEVVAAAATTSRTGRTVQSCVLGVGYGEDEASGRATKLKKMLASPHATNVTVR
jgi:hypothetical protein